MTATATTANTTHLDIIPVVVVVVVVAGNLVRGVSLQLIGRSPPTLLIYWGTAHSEVLATAWEAMPGRRINDLP